MPDAAQKKHSWQMSLPSLLSLSLSLVSLPDSAFLPPSPFRRPAVSFSYSSHTPLTPLTPFHLRTFRFVRSVLHSLPCHDGYTPCVLCFFLLSPCRVKRDSPRPSSHTANTFHSRSCAYRIHARNPEPLSINPTGHRASRESPRRNRGHRHGLSTLPHFKKPSP